MTLNITPTLHFKDPQPFPDVHHIQARLVGKGFSVGPYGIDGYYGKDSQAAVNRFKAHHGLVQNAVVDATVEKLLDATVAPASISAHEFADLCYRLVTTGIDGTPPRYVFGAEIANLNDPSPDKLDCSELVQWGVYQKSSPHTSWVDGSANQAAHCKIISADQAIHTKGALLFVSNNGHPSGVHHVAVSMGNGKTAEARSAYMTPQCGSWSAAGRFSFGGLVPVLHY